MDNGQSDGASFGSGCQSFGPQPASPFSRSGIPGAWQTLAELLADLKARFAVRGAPTQWAAKQTITDENILSVLSGRREPGPKLLALLGYERTTVYRRITPCACYTCTNERVAAKPMPAHEMIFGVIDPRTHRYFLCETCGNKRCPHANDHRNACTGSNEPGQNGSRYAAQGIAAPSGGKTGTGLTVGKSPTPQGDAPNIGDPA